MVEPVGGASIAGAGLLMGTYTPKLDDKGRLILPAKLRPRLASGLAITRGQERCLYIYPDDEFARLHERMKQAPVTSKEARTYIRVLFSGAHSEIPDKQGRISIPQALREYAGLDRDVAVVGVGDRAEIWDAKAWDEYLSASEAEYSNIAEQILPELAF